VTQLYIVENYQVIEAFARDRADETRDMAVSNRRARARPSAAELI
jgi:hypothetical protein